MTITKCDSASYVGPLPLMIEDLTRSPLVLLSEIEQRPA